MARRLTSCAEMGHYQIGKATRDMCFTDPTRSSKRNHRHGRAGERSPSRRRRRRASHLSSNLRSSSSLALGCRREALPQLTILLLALGCRKEAPPWPSVSSLPPTARCRLSGAMVDIEQQVATAAAVDAAFEAYNPSNDPKRRAKSKNLAC